MRGNKIALHLRLFYKAVFVALGTRYSTYTRGSRKPLARTDLSLHHKSGSGTGGGGDGGGGASTAAPAAPAAATEQQLVLRCTAVDSLKRNEIHRALNTAGVRCCVARQRGVGKKVGGVVGSAVCNPSVNY
jgi:hypothetical protein